MIPLVTINLALEAFTETLRAFNGLDQATRNRIVNTMIDDAAKREAAWEKFKAWFQNLIAGVQP